jgi:hypothetical protein
MKEGVRPLSFDLDLMGDEERNSILIAALEWMRKAGRLPLPVYLERVRTFPTVFVEIVTVCSGATGAPEILLEKRPDNDPYFPGMHCTQGITVMVRDTLEDVARNHGEKESGIPWTQGENLIFAGVASLPLLEREHAVTMIFLRRFPKKPDSYQGEFFPLTALPEPMVGHMRETVIPIVVGMITQGRASFGEYLGTQH